MCTAPAFNSRGLVVVELTCALVMYGVDPNGKPPLLPLHGPPACCEECSHQPCMPCSQQLCTKLPKSICGADLLPSSCPQAPWISLRLQLCPREPAQQQTVQVAVHPRGLGLGQRAGGGHQRPIAPRTQRLRCPSQGLGRASDRGTTCVCRRVHSQQPVVSSSLIWICLDGRLGSRTRRQRQRR